MTPPLKENDTERDSAGKCKGQDYRRMGAIGQEHSKQSNREDIDNMQQRSKIVGRGSKRGHKSKERGVRKIYIDKNYGSTGGVCHG